MRYNKLQQVQVALRSSLLHTCVSIELSSATAYQQLHDVLQKTVQQIKMEEQLIFPLIFDYEPSVWDVFTRQHHKLMNQVRHLQSLLHELSILGADADGEIFSDIQQAFEYFMSVSFQHMDEEEEVLNEILWRYYNDDELMRLGKEQESMVSFLQQYNAPKTLQPATAA
ncbi:DUF494 family protein [Aridibaculum aurantiacum]|uniref:DUF494 family protein n=1 Tax=Aridibaculum aurantiacum TaxID=2810307 RepID=UPI001A96A346|nr:DUF494 family protein [Aridibaculum aurantiacum]